jgi:beta-glucanase (GH16 family)
LALDQDRNLVVRNSHQHRLGSTVILAALVALALLALVVNGKKACAQSSDLGSQDPVGRHLDLSKMKLTFSDDFKNGLDASPDGKRRWKTTYAWGNRTLATNHEAQFYSDSTVGVDPFSIHDGALDITAAPASPGEGTPEGSGLTFTSGAITTEGSFSQLYGYFEMRAKLPTGRGLWPAFWLLPADLSWPPELDIFEQLGHEPNKIYVSYHSTTDDVQVNPRTVADTSHDFHTYGVDWEPDFLTWYFDGQAIARNPTPKDMNQPMYILANLAVGAEGSWPEATDQTTVLPAHMLIQSIRAFQRVDR